MTNTLIKLEPTLIKLFAVNANWHQTGILKECIFPNVFPPVFEIRCGGFQYKYLKLLFILLFQVSIHKY